METYANWSLKLHNYSSRAGGGDCATNHRSAATVMTLTVGESLLCSWVKTVYKVEHMEGTKP